MKLLTKELATAIKQDLYFGTGKSLAFDVIFSGAS
jgi:hypothetical protein